jgi:hypothetical protein
LRVVRLGTGEFNRPGWQPQRPFLAARRSARSRRPCT